MPTVPFPIVDLRYMQLLQSTEYVLVLILDACTPAIMHDGDPFLAHSLAHSYVATGTRTINAALHSFIINSSLTIASLVHLCS